MNLLKSLIIATSIFSLSSINAEASLNNLILSIPNAHVEKLTENKKSPRSIDKWMPVQYQINDELISFKFPELDNSFTYAGNDFFTMGTCTEDSDPHGEVLDWELGYVTSGTVLPKGQSAQTIYDEIFKNDVLSGDDEDEDGDKEPIPYTLLVNEIGEQDGHDFINLVIDYPTKKQRVHVHMIVTDSSFYLFGSYYHSDQDDNLDTILKSVKIEKIKQD